MTKLRIALYSFAACALLSSWTTANAQPKAKLKPKTVAAFEEFVKEIESEHKLALAGKKPFLWAAEKGKDVRGRLRRGELVIIKDRKNKDIPGGIIHIWGVATFLPDEDAEDVVKLLQDYDHHKDYYPSVVDSKLLARDGDIVRGFLRFRYKKVITVVLDTEHESELIKLDDGKYALHVRSTRIVQIEDPGEPSEKELPVGQDSGFLWRLNTYWAVLEGEGGVFLECESISLTRAIPRGFGWLIRPFVESIPRDSLEELVEGTRMALGK